jgi:hypothetical protein
VTIRLDEIALPLSFPDEAILLYFHIFQIITGLPMIFLLFGRHHGGERPITKTEDEGEEYVPPYFDLRFCPQFS